MNAVVRLPPQDVETEAAVLGSCLLSADALSVAMDYIDADVFYQQKHAEIFRHMVALFASSDPVDIVTILGRLRDADKLEAIGGPMYLSNLVDQIATPSLMPGYCRRLRDKWILRKMISHCSEVIEKCYGGLSSHEVADYAETGMFDLVAEHSVGIDQIGELVDESVKQLEKRCASDGGVTGVPTGFVDLDRKLAGLHGGDLLLLAARPSMGKTALAMNIVRNVAVESNVPALVFSMEMSGQQLTERVLSGCSLVNGQNMRTGALSNTDWPKIHAAADKLKSAQIFIDSGSSLSIIDVRARARRMKSRYGIGLIAIDYLQLMRGMSRGGREQEIAEISRGLKSLAKELNIPVIALCQLNRSLESRTDKRPMLSDLRESGSLEQDADVIMFIYRDEYYHPGRDNKSKAELIIGKQRSGPVGTVNMIFQKEVSTFRSAA